MNLMRNRTRNAVAAAVRAVLRRDYTFGHLTNHRFPDIAPHGDCPIMRWPNGDIWIPTSMPEAALSRRPTRADWQKHAAAAAAQIRALARVVTLAEGEPTLPSRSDQHLEARSNAPTIRTTTASPTSSRCSPTVTDNYDISIVDTGAFAVQILNRDTGTIVGEANDLDTIDEALSHVRRFYAG